MLFLYGLVMNVLSVVVLVCSLWILCRMCLMFGVLVLKCVVVEDVDDVEVLMDIDVWYCDVWDGVM